jgi:hypothetical protein
VNYENRTLIVAPRECQAAGQLCQPVSSRADWSVLGGLPTPLRSIEVLSTYTEFRDTNNVWFG